MAEHPDLDTIERAAKAALKAEERARAENRDAADIEDDFTKRHVLSSYCDPATVLELCRLAGIGEEFLRIQAVLKEYVRQTNREDLHQ